MHVDHVRPEPFAGYNPAISTFLTNGLKPNTTLYFPTVQECEQGISRWIDIPPLGAEHMHELKGMPMPESKSPAPGIKLVPQR